MFYWFAALCELTIRSLKIVLTIERFFGTGSRDELDCCCRVGNIYAKIRNAVFFILFRYFSFIETVLYFLRWMRSKSFATLGCRRLPTRLMFYFLSLLRAAGPCLPLTEKWIWSLTNPTLLGFVMQQQLFNWEICFTKNKYSYVGYNRRVKHKLSACFFTFNSRNYYLFKFFANQMNLCTISNLPRLWFFTNCWKTIISRPVFFINNISGRFSNCVNIVYRCRTIQQEEIRGAHHIVRFYMS